MFYKSFFSVIYVLSAVGTEIQGVQLTSSHDMYIKKTCTNMPHEGIREPAPPYPLKKYISEFILEK